MRFHITKKIATFLKRTSSLRIVIIDDEQVYFNEQMIELAARVGYKHIERYFWVDQALLNSLLENPPDIAILDIKGVTDPQVAKDGFSVAEQLQKFTATYVAVTSAHRHHLKNPAKVFDYVIEERLLTSADFALELEELVDTYLQKKAKFYQHVFLRIGVSLGRYSLSIPN